MFKPMDPDLIRSLLEDQPDVLTEEVAKDKALFNSFPCPMCERRGSEKIIPLPKVAMTPKGPMVISSPFVDGQLLPQGHARCKYCGTEFDPYTRIIIKSEASMIASPLEGPLQE